jgi:hypothetical protein
MAKIPPVAPATEWMTESLVIVVWAPDIDEAAVRLRGSFR